MVLSNAGGAWTSDACFRGHLVEGIAAEPEILVINSNSCGACAYLAIDASQADLVGIDAEWAPDWNKFSDNPISVLQLAFPRSGRVYILQLEQMEGLPTEVQMMLLSSEVLKVGFAVRGTDCSKFRRSGIAIGEFLDLQNACEMMACSAGILIQPSSMGLAHAVRLVLVEEMLKDKRISCSNWAATILTREQVHYAAMDAWVLLRLYGAICFQFGHVSQAGSAYFLSGFGWQADQDIFLSETTPKRQAVNYSGTQYDAAAAPDKIVAVAAASLGLAAIPSSSSKLQQPVEPMIGTTASNVVTAAAAPALPERARGPRVVVAPPKEEEEDGEFAMSRSRQVATLGRNRSSVATKPMEMTRHVYTDLGAAPFAKPATVVLIRRDSDDKNFCYPSDFSFRHFKLAMLVSLFSFFVFPPGLPALVLIPLHLLLVWVLLWYEIIPEPPPALMMAYVIGCFIRIVAGICSFVFRYFFPHEVIGAL